MMQYALTPISLQAKLRQYSHACEPPSPTTFVSTLQRRSLPDLTEINRGSSQAAPAADNASDKVSRVLVATTFCRSSELLLSVVQFSLSFSQFALIWSGSLSRMAPVSLILCRGYGRFSRIPIKLLSSVASDLPNLCTILNMVFSKLLILNQPAGWSFRIIWSNFNDEVSWMNASNNGVTMTYCFIVALQQSLHTSHVTRATFCIVVIITVTPSIIKL